VIAIDWGSLTAMTIEQLMRLAAEAGAESFRAIVFLSQMPIEDELYLRHIRKVCGLKGTRTNPPPGQMTFDAASLDEKFEERIIPAEVNFLTSVRIGYYTATECPMCATREHYEQQEELCPIEPLRQHAKECELLLQERDRGTVLGEPQHDLYGVLITQKEIADLVHLRALLETALRSTEDRDAVKSEVLRVCRVGTPSEKVAWVRLLAAEPNRLKLPPLSFEELRDYVANIALSIAADCTGLYPTIGIKQQAIVV
jgi:hypothetical protein